MCGGYEHRGSEQYELMCYKQSVYHQIVLNKLRLDFKLSSPVTIWVFNTVYHV